MRAITCKCCATLSVRPIAKNNILRIFSSRCIFHNAARAALARSAQESSCTDCDVYRISADFDFSFSFDFAE